MSICLGSASVLISRHMGLLGSTPTLIDIQNLTICRRHHMDKCHGRVIDVSRNRKAMYIEVACILRSSEILGGPHGLNHMFDMSLVCLLVRSFAYVNLSRCDICF